MGLENTRSIHQPATLHAVAHTPVACMMTHIANDCVTLYVENTQQFPLLNNGDLAELHIQLAGKLLKIKSRFEHKRGNNVSLSYINPQDSSVRQLVNWFSQPAHSAGSLVNEAAILKEMQEISLQQLDMMLELFLEQTDQRLLHLAEMATSNDQQNRIFEAKSLLRRHRQTIHQQFCNLVRNRFSEPDSSTTETQPHNTRVQLEDLALVDLEAFEDWLSLEVISRRAKERYFIPLTCLSQRFNKLYAKPLSSEQLPVGIHALCQTLQATLKHYSISNELLPVLYRFFDESVIQRLDDLYDQLNGRLKNYNILPYLESQVLRSHHQAASKTQHLPTEHGTLTPHAMPATNNTVLYSTVRELMALLRTASVQEQPPASPIDQQQIVTGLAELQHNPQAMEAIAGGLSLGECLQQSLNLKLSGESSDLIELTSRVFRTLADYPQIPLPLIKQINRLQVPMARLALVDPSVYVQADHPARRLMNQLIELCLKSDMSSRALENKLDTLISDIGDNFDQNSHVFQQALDKLLPIIDQQEHAAQRNTERVAQTYEGRQRVQKAQEAVDREIQRRISASEVPEVVLELLDNGWRELLKLTYLKSGPDNPDWHQYLDTLDQLLLWLEERSAAFGQQDTEFDSIAEADSFADLLSQELNNVFPGDYRYHDTVEKIRDTLKGRRPITVITPDTQPGVANAPHHELLKELEAAHPQLARWFKRANGLKVGDEFCYFDDKTGQRNIKLAWISDNRQHFVFVNNRGQKVYDYDMVDLANELSNGLTPMAESQEWPLVERSLYSTVQQAYEKLSFKSTHDELTGLINRKECERLLNNALLDAKHNRQHHCLLYLNIDNFALANNLHGHVAGDQFLIEVSKLLQTQFAKNTQIARMAGDEFIVLLQKCSLQDSLPIAENLRQHLQGHAFQWQGHTVQFTASIGLVDIDKFTNNVVDLLRNAVSTCSTAKAGGGNRVQVFRQDSELHQRREKLLSWIDKLNSVLNSNLLTLRGQRISPLNGNSSGQDHYEVLLAIRDEQGQLQSPVEFIEAAECYNRMQKVDRWVIEKTFQWLHELSTTRKPLPEVSINLSGNSLNDELFMEFILEQFATYKVPTGNVCFEVTETATINNLALAADFIREIKKIGCKFSLDDFGSGNASYQYLKHLPVDFLKIDGTFVREIPTSKNDYALVKSIHEIAHLMGIKTIAEYAESNEVVDMLKTIGVDYMQGYAIGKPVPLNQLFTA